MSKSKSLFFLFLLFSKPVFSMPYLEYLKLAIENSIPVNIAKKTINASRERAKAADLYFIPTLSINPILKYEITKDVGSVRDEVKGSLSSRLYSTTVFDKMDEVDATIADAKLLLLIEQERLNSQILKNVVSIQYYEKLLSFALKLNKDTFVIKERVEKQYLNGTASENNLNRTNLLISRIESEINSINKQIDLYESNIEATTGIEFPESGIQISKEQFDKVINFQMDEENLIRNKEYQSLKAKYDVARNAAVQPDTFLTVDLSLENTLDYDEKREELNNDYKIQLSANFNFFNFGKRKEEKAQMYESEAANLKIDFKMLEMKNSLKTFVLLESSYLGEMNNLNLQISQTKKLIAGHDNEYLAGKVDLYEMLNTRFDLFTSTKQKTDVEIQFAQNKIDLMQLGGYL